MIQEFNDRGYCVRHPGNPTEGSWDRPFCRHCGFVEKDRNRIVTILTESALTRPFDADFERWLSDVRKRILEE